MEKNVNPSFAVATPSNLQIRLARIFKIKRLAAGLSIEELANTINTSYVSLDRYEQRGDIDFETFFRLTKHFQIHQDLFACLVPIDKRNDLRLNSSSDVASTLSKLKLYLRLTYENIVQKTNLSRTTIISLLNDGKGKLNTFIQVACAMERTKDLAESIERLKMSIDTGTELSFSGTTGTNISKKDSEESFTYSMYIEEYRNCRRSFNLTQKEVGERNRNLEADTYIDFERYGVCTIRNWIEINFALGLDQRLFQLFGHDELDQLPLLMPKPQLLQLLVCKRVILARETKLLRRVELGRRIGISDKVLDSIEAGLGGKLGTLFSIFEALNMKQHLLDVFDPNTKITAGEFEIRNIEKLNAIKLTILVADRFSHIRRQKSISIDQLAESSGLNQRKIERFEATSYIYLDRFMKIANDVSTAICRTIMELVGITFDKDWSNKLRERVIAKRRAKNLSRAELSALTDIHQQELLWFETKTIISLENFFVLCQVLFDDFNTQALMENIMQL